MATWTVWLELAEAQEPWFGAAGLVVGIHLVHSYEVALLKHGDFRATLMERGVIVITTLESIGGVWALWLAARGGDGYPLLVLFLALLTEHILQVIALKKGSERAMMPSIAHATHH